MVVYYLGNRATELNRSNQPTADYSLRLTSRFYRKLDGLWVAESLHFIGLEIDVMVLTIGKSDNLILGYFVLA